MNVSVVIATYGNESWQELAITRAMPSVPDDVTVVLSHENTLHEARNEGLRHVTTEFVVFLDADDELSPDYFEHMAEGTADIRVPSVSYVRNGRPRPPIINRVFGHDHDCNGECLRHGNWIVIGAAAKTHLVRAVGGFHDFPWSEDWATWALCVKAGGTVEAIPEAVYVAHVRDDSRNRAPDRAAKVAAHRAIERFVWPEDFAA